MTLSHFTTNCEGTPREDFIVGKNVGFCKTNSDKKYLGPACVKYDHRDDEKTYIVIFF